MDSALIIIGIIISYLIGSFSTAVFIGRWFHGIDVREHGSGNAGATNTVRVLGVKTGLTVLLIDVFKGWLAVTLPGLFVPEVTGEAGAYIKLAFALAVVLGHIFPIYTSFKGGKGVATLLGVGLALFPAASLIVLGWFILMLVLFRYVSLGSVTGAILFPLIVNFILPGPPPATPFILLSIIVGIAVPLTHIKNIKRLLRGEENKFRLKAKRQQTKELQVEDPEKNY